MFAHGLGGSPSAGYKSKDGSPLKLPSFRKIVKMLMTITYLIHSGYLQREDCNFISVDWSVMAAAGDYNYVGTYYVPLAGNLTGEYINFLVSQGTPLSAFHLVGHR